MKRKIQSKFALALAILFTIFTLPANGLAASAEDNGITPDKAYEVDYTIKHEDGINESVADGFFEKPGILLEEDGKTYIQMTVTRGEMVKRFKGKYSEAIVVKNNEGGSKVLQLRVDDLSNMPLDMHIIVGGDAVHGLPGNEQTDYIILAFANKTKI